MTATTPQIGLDELRTLFLFESLRDEDLQWIADHAEVRVFDGRVTPPTRCTCCSTAGCG
jgi:hypothetical protein